MCASTQGASLVKACADGISTLGNAAGKFRPFPDTILHIPRETRQFWNAFRYTRPICHVSYSALHTQLIKCDKQEKETKNIFF